MRRYVLRTVFRLSREGGIRTCEDANRSIAILFDVSTHEFGVAVDEQVESEICFGCWDVDFSDHAIHGARDARLVTFSRTCLTNVVEWTIETVGRRSISIGENSFSWIDAVRQCVQMVFNPLLHRCNSGPSCEEIQTASNRSYDYCFTSPPGGRSVCTVALGDWYRIFWTVKASLTINYAVVSRNMLSSCLRCGGSYSQQLRRSFYSIMVTRRTVVRTTAVAKRAAEEPMTDDELAHAVVKNISQRLHWDNESSVDWYAFSAGKSQPSGTVRIQVRQKYLY